MLLVVSLAVAVCWLQLYRLLQNNAVEEVRQEAGLLMQSAVAVRTYTIEQIKPKLESQLEEVFMPQTVPAFAATETFNELSKAYPEYSYKEATLNPTNPRDQADDFEQGVVQSFDAPGSPEETSGIRHVPGGNGLYVARPIRILKPACLDCHSTPDAAPYSMIKTYGRDNGFGWKLGQVIGVQIVTVPMSVPLARANKAFYSFIGVLVGVFVLMALLINWMLDRFVVRPVLHIAAAADQISSGKLDQQQLDESGRDEVAVLARSFNRMATSLRKAMELLRRSRS
jgi:protein-histidine pros-kinase